MSDDDLLDFVRGSIRSVWALELLLLLRRTPERAWSVEALVSELRASGPLVAEVLAALTAAGLVQDDGAGAFAFAPAGPALETLAGRLEQLYRESPVRVINLIVGARADKLQSLADAFRLRGDKA